MLSHGYSTEHIERLSETALVVWNCFGRVHEGNHSPDWGNTKLALTNNQEAPQEILVKTHNRFRKTTRSGAWNHRDRRR